MMRAGGGESLLMAAVQRIRAIQVRLTGAAPSLHNQALPSSVVLRAKAQVETNTRGRSRNTKRAKTKGSPGDAGRGCRLDSPEVFAF